MLVMKQKVLYLAAVICAFALVVIPINTQAAELALEDGEYVVPVTMIHATGNTASMAASTLEGKAKLTVADDDAVLNIVFQETTLMGLDAYLSKLSIFDTYPEGSLTEATVISNLSNSGIKEVSFAVALGEADTFVQMEVPVMIEMGVPSVDARIRIDYSDIKEYVGQADTTAWDTVVSQFEVYPEENFTQESYAAVVAVKENTRIELFASQAEVNASIAALKAAIQNELVLDIGDGYYTINGRLWHATNDAASMAAGVFDTVALEIWNGEIDVIVNAKMAVIFGQQAYLNSLLYTNSDGEVVEATVIARELANENISQVRFPILENREMTEVRANGSAARLYLDFSTLTRTGEAAASDKTNLQTAVTEEFAEVLYTEETYEVYAIALAQANAILGKETARQYQIDTALENLASAIAGLESIPASISLNKLALTFTGNGKAETLVATVQGTTQAVTWTSSNTAVATVSSTGVVTSRAAGTAVITARVEDVAASCTVTVNAAWQAPIPTPPSTPAPPSTPTPAPAKASIKLNRSKATIYTKRQTKVTLQATVTGSSKAVTWRTSNKKVATVNNKGVVTAKKKGTATITATANGVSVTCRVTVRNPSVKVQKTRVTLRRGKRATIKATALPSGKITYKTNNKSVATVSKKGVIRARRKGTAKITVRANGVKRTVTVKVK